MIKKHDTVAKHDLKNVTKFYHAETLIGRVKNHGAAEIMQTMSKKMTLLSVCLNSVIFSLPCGTHLPCGVTVSWKMILSCLMQARWCCGSHYAHREKTLDRWCWGKVVSTVRNRKMVLWRTRWCNVPCGKKHGVVEPTKLQNGNIAQTSKMTLRKQQKNLFVTWKQFVWTKQIYWMEACDKETSFLRRWENNISIAACQLMQESLWFVHEVRNPNYIV